MTIGMEVNLLMFLMTHQLVFILFLFIFLDLQI